METVKVTVDKVVDDKVQVTICDFRDGHERKIHTNILTEGASMNADVGKEKVSYYKEKVFEYVTNPNEIVVRKP